jgi:arginine repressor
MISKDLIKIEIEKVPEERLAELYSVVKRYAEPARNGDGQSLMSKLREIAIEAPEDFAENIDLYLAGEKTVG